MFIRFGIKWGVVFYDEAGAWVGRGVGWFVLWGMGALRGGFIL